MMFNLNSCIEVFGVHVEPQPSVLFAAVNKAVEPLCQFTFFDLHYNDISSLVPNVVSLTDSLPRTTFRYTHFASPIGNTLASVRFGRISSGVRTT